MIVQFIDLVSHSESTLLGGLDGGFLLTSQEIKFLLGLNYNYMVYRKQHNNRKRPTNWHGRRHDHQVPATKPNQGREERERERVRQKIGAFIEGLAAFGTLSFRF